MIQKRPEDMLFYVVPSNLYADITKKTHQMVLVTPKYQRTKEVNRRAWLIFSFAMARILRDKFEMNGSNSQTTLRGLMRYKQVRYTCERLLLIARMCSRISRFNERGNIFFFLLYCFVLFCSVRASLYIFTASNFVIFSSRCVVGWFGQFFFFISFSIFFSLAGRKHVVDG